LNQIYRRLEPSQNNLPVRAIDPEPDPDQLSSARPSGKSRARLAFLGSPAKFVTLQLDSRALVEHDALYVLVFLALN
jgi:hypothetical protein